MDRQLPGERMQLSLIFTSSRRRPYGPPHAGSGPLEFRGVQRATILAVDDEPDALDFLHTLLVGEGFDFMRATSGAQALSLIEGRRPDLLIVDVMMAGMNGIELCIELRDRRDTRLLPIILYSAHDMKRHSNAGLYDHAFVKPADPDALVWAIRGLLPQNS